MKTYPDLWVMLKITNNETSEVTYKILASWRGGYLDGDSWRLNSGISSITKDKDVYIVKGFSGSEYHCNEQRVGMTGYTSNVFESIKNKIEIDNLGTVEIVPIEEFGDIV